MVTDFTKTKFLCGNRTSLLVCLQGKKLADGVKAEALYNWQAKKDNHLSFKAGDILLLKEEQDMWWLGELNGKQGWFPKTQVKQLPEK